MTNADVRLPDTDTPSRQQIRPTAPWIWLGVFFVLNLFAGGKWVVPLFAWIAPVFALRFLELTPRWRGAAGFFVASLVSFKLGTDGLIPLAPAEAIAMGAIGSVVAYGISILHLKAVKFLPSLAATLVYPCAVVSLEYVSSAGPFGTWVALASTQYGNLPLMQLASVTGVWGVSFLVAWTAAVLHWAWSHGFSPPVLRPVVLTWAGMLLVVFAAGQARLVFCGREPGRIAVAAVSPGSLAFEEQPVSQYLAAQLDPAGPTTEQRAQFEQAFHQRAEDLLQRTRIAAEAGADWIYWSEVALVGDRELLEAYRQRVDRLCREFNVYVGMSVGVPVVREGRQMLENKILLQGPTLAEPIEYWKTKIVPGEPSIAGDGAIPIVDVEDTTVAHVICFDTDFPSFIRQVGEQGADILFAPSNDWPEAARPHLAVAAYRALENGCSLVRATSNGISVALDPWGQVRGELVSIGGEGGILLAHLPAGRLRTIYTYVGDSFAWLASLGLVVSVGMLVYRYRRPGRI